MTASKDSAGQPSDRRDTVSTLVHGLDALAALNRHPMLTAQQLAAQLGISRTATRRLLDTLVAAGMAGKSPGDSHYRLAPGAAGLSSGLTIDMILAEIATPLLHAATREWGWTVSLVTLTHEEVVLQVTTARQASYAITYFPVGNRLPAEASQAGQVMLAFQDDGRRVDPDFAARVRKDGYHAPIDPGQRESHLYAPLHLRGGIAGCLIMRYLLSAMPRARLIERHAPRLRALAARIAEEAETAMRDRMPAWVPAFTR